MSVLLWNFVTTAFVAFCFLHMFINQNQNCLAMLAGGSSERQPPGPQNQEKRFQVWIMHQGVCPGHYLKVWYQGAQEFWISIHRARKRGPKKGDFLISESERWARNETQLLSFPGAKKVKLLSQDVISVIFLGIYPASNTSIYTLSIYARRDHQSCTSYKNPSFSDQFCNTSSKLKFHCSIRSIPSEKTVADLIKK